jgi:hypothetical protein
LRSPPTVIPVLTAKRTRHDWLEEGKKKKRVYGEPSMPISHPLITSEAPRRNLKGAPDVLESKTELFEANLPV